MLTKNQLSNYAQIMVNCALNGGKGINKGETVIVFSRESAKPLYWKIYEAIITAGGNVIPFYLPDESDIYGENRILLENASDEQLNFFPEAYWRGLVDSADHLMFLLSSADVNLLQGIDSKKIMAISKARSPWMDMRDAKEKQGKLFWTLCLYPTQSMANEAGMKLEEYSQEIVEACYLDDPDPVARWRKTLSDIELVKTKLTEMQIEKVHLEGEDMDLWITLGEKRRWLGGSGHNIPSFEVFISPDWRGTNGWIQFNQPLYSSGKRISGIKLSFQEGVIVKASASENEEALLAMINEKNANKLGEFSLTDKRHSKITRFMADTLFDENIGGENGNTHIAVGDSYRDSYDGDICSVSEEEFATLGFNNCSSVHTDMVSTTPRKVTAYFSNKNKEAEVIYENGQFNFLL
jgi:aminopeptidase